MKKSDLHREWARVLDMCEGTKVDPNVCWGFWGNRTDQGAPEFIQDPGGYEFAVAILEDKPVFVGDKVYGAVSGDAFIAESGGYRSKHNELIAYMCDFFKFAWNPPKKTFMLNGVDVPCPIMKSHKNILELKANNTHCFFYFDTVSDADKCRSVLFKILTENTK